MKKNFLKVFSAAALSLIAFASLSGCNTQYSSIDSSSSNSENSVVPGETLIKISGETGVEVGQTTTLKTTVYGPNSAVNFSSSDTSIATVDSMGIVTGVKPGFVTITAESVLSTDANPIKSSFTLFVEPAYVVTMVNAFRSIDYTAGATFDGNFFIENSFMEMNYSLALQDNKNLETSADSYQFDFALNPPAMLSSLIYGLLQPGFTGKSVNLAYLGGSDAYCYSVSSKDDATVGFYKSFNPLSTLASLINPSLISTIVGSKTIDSTNPESAIGTLGLTLNSLLDFSSDASEGISLNATALTLLNSGVTSLKNAIAADESMDSTLKLLVPQFLPYDISEFRFLVETNDDGSFKDLHVKVTDNKPDETDSSAAPTSYTYFDFTLNKNATALAPNYFKTLETTLGTAEEDSKTIATIEASVSHLQAEVDAYNGSIYDILNFNSSFVDEIASYHKDVQPLLKTVTNTSLIPTESGSLLGGYQEINYDFGPYESYAVTFKDDAHQSIVGDNYKAKVNDVFSLSEITPVGGTDKTFTTVPTFGLSLSDDKKVVSDYATLDGTTLTINQLPTDADLTLTVTPSAVDGYTAVPFNLDLVASK